MLTDADKEHFRQLVERRLREIPAAAAGTGGDRTEPVALDQTRVGRLSRIDALQQQAMAAGLQLSVRRERQRLDAALVRIANGTFGTCCQCGDAVPRERLEADPGAPFCAHCQEEIEESGKRRG